jgi:hypothetical protein
MDRRELPYSWSEVKGRLQRDILGVLERFGIAERAAGPVIQPLNPTRADRKPGSFCIWVRETKGGGGIGAWHDYATGEKGDIFDLVAYLGRLQGKMDVYWWALDHLNLGRGTVRTKEQAQQDIERVNRDRLAREAKATEAELANGEKLLKRWLEMKPLAGTLGETYLIEARRLPLDRLPEPRDKRLGALRFTPELEHVDEDTGEVTAWPAIVSAMARGTKGVTALHRTWLAPDGSGKAPVAKPKKMIGSTRGASIRLTKGKGGYTPGEAEKRGERGFLILGEGIETSLSVALALPDYRAWSAGSLTLMGLIEWPAYVSGVVLLQDNDWGEQARAAFHKVEAHWRSQAAGRPVKVAAAWEGSDWNDVARAGASS